MTEEIAPDDRPRCQAFSDPEETGGTSYRCSRTPHAESDRAHQHVENGKQVARWLSPAARTCGVMSNSKYACTLPSGHEGNHMAHGIGNKVLCDWSDPVQAAADAVTGNLGAVAMSEEDWASFQEAMKKALGQLMKEIEAEDPSQIDLGTFVAYLAPVQEWARARGACAEISTDGAVCVLPAGHGGDHVALDGERQVRQTWGETGRVDAVTAAQVQQGADPRQVSSDALIRDHQEREARDHQERVEREKTVANLVRGILLFDTLIDLVPTISPDVTPIIEAGYLEVDENDPEGRLKLSDEGKQFLAQLVSECWASHAQNHHVRVRRSCEGCGGEMPDEFIDPMCPNCYALRSECGCWYCLENRAGASEKQRQIYADELAGEVKAEEDARLRITTPQLGLADQFLPGGLANFLRSLTGR